MPSQTCCSNVLLATWLLDTPRYYWNEETGESTYLPPPSYTPAPGPPLPPAPTPASLNGVPSQPSVPEPLSGPSIVALTHAGAVNGASVPAAQLLLTQAVNAEAGAPLPHANLHAGPAPAHVPLPSALNSIPVITAPPSQHGPVIR
jgi:hypothetical protein